MTESLIFVSCPISLTVVCSLMATDKSSHLPDLGQVKGMGNVSNQ